MRSRSVLVILSLLAFTAAPVEATKKGRTKQPKKVAAQKKAAGKKPGKDKPTGNAIGMTRKDGQAPQGEGTLGDAASRSVVARSAKPVQRNRPVRRTATRTVHTAPHAPAVGVAPAVAPAAKPAFDTRAAVAPKRRGRVKRWFVGMLVAVGLTAGAFGWQAADMNSKVGDAWDWAGTQIEQIFDGGGGGNGNPGPLPPDPIPDPGPQPDPGPGDPSDPSDPGDPSDPSDPQQEPGPQQPAPKGGDGKQTPKGPETPRGG